MNQTVQLTSQGQISIPSKMRKQLKIQAPGRVTLTLKNDRIEVKPVVDILALGGVLHKYAIKNKSPEEIRKLEKEAIAQMYVESYLDEDLSN